MFPKPTKGSKKRKRQARKEAAKDLERRTRAEVRARDDGVCMYPCSDPPYSRPPPVCGNRDGVQVHEIVGRGQGWPPDVTFAVKNRVCLCLEHHGHGEDRKLCLALQAHYRYDYDEQPWRSVLAGRRR